MILVLDNYDSFSFNLVQLLGRHTREIMVRRNDECTLDELHRLGPKGILISPGPGRPEKAGVSVEVIKTLGRSIPVLGICLGHQAIGVAFGGRVIHAPSLVHGRTSLILHNGTPLYRGVSNPFPATRYHSLVISRDDLPSELDVTAWTEDGVLMGIRHRHYPVEGVQFHPESILTYEGERIVQNWMEVYRCQ
jgi:anthranilate synthase component 2